MLESYSNHIYPVGRLRSLLWAKFRRPCPCSWDAKKLSIKMSLGSRCKFCRIGERAAVCRSTTSNSNPWHFIMHSLITIVMHWRETSRTTPTGWNIKVVSSLNLFYFYNLIVISLSLSVLGCHDRSQWIQPAQEANAPLNINMHARSADECGCCWFWKTSTTSSLLLPD